MFGGAVRIEFFASQVSRDWTPYLEMPTAGPTQDKDTLSTSSRCSPSYAFSFICYCSSVDSAFIAGQPWNMTATRIYLFNKTENYQTNNYALYNCALAIFLCSGGNISLGLLTLRFATFVYTCRKAEYWWIRMMTSWLTLWLCKESPSCVKGEKLCIYPSGSMFTWCTIYIVEFE